jgi:glycosyltransferase involved in cell wall biosynthesis
MMTPAVHLSPVLLSPESRVDVVVLTHDRPAAMLTRAVRSALSLESLHEVLVIDNGSKRPVLVTDLPADARVRLIRCDPPAEKRGPSFGRNVGLEAASSPWVVLLDDDDELIPAGVVSAIDLARRLHAVASLIARINILPRGEEREKPVPEEWKDITLPSAADVFRPIALFGGSGLLVSRRAIDAGVRFDPNLAIGEDRDFIRKLAELGPVAVSSARALRVTIHAGQENLSSSARMSRRIRDHLIILDRYPDQPTQAHLRDATRWLVNAASKSGVDSTSWTALLKACRARGWSVPLKSRWRRLLRPARGN